MPLFLGTHRPRLDEKGRLFLPAKFRDQLSGGLVMTKGQEGCLYVFPAQAFEASVSAALAAASITDRNRGQLRVMLSGAHHDAPDRQGRVTIPPDLRVYASLTRECTVIGAGDHVEVWDAAAWEAYLAEQEPAYANVAPDTTTGGAA